VDSSLVSDGGRWACRTILAERERHGHDDRAEHQAKYPEHLESAEHGEEDQQLVEPRALPTSFGDRKLSIDPIARMPQPTRIPALTYSPVSARSRAAGTHTRNGPAIGIIDRK
jgi:hypothetical protein